MEILHRTVVAPEEIDHLGHMNVHFYGVHARTGADRLLDALGAVPPSSAVVVVQTDTYVRHHREQREGASLEIRGGVLDVSPSTLRLYEELANADDGELAATFILTFALVHPETRAPVLLTDDVMTVASAHRVAVPEHGRWRSISPDEDVVGGAPSLATVEERDLAHREIRTITEEECDEHGVGALPIANLVWGGVPLPGRAFEPLHQLADGGQMGFATLETRASWARVPRVGDRVRSYSAEVERGTKTMLTRNWVFDVDAGGLIAVFSVVNVAFDTAARRAIPIPEELRRRWDVRYHPDLA